MFALREGVVPRFLAPAFPLALALVLAFVAVAVEDEVLWEVVEVKEVLWEAGEAKEDELGSGEALAGRGTGMSAVDSPRKVLPLVVGICASGGST